MKQTETLPKITNLDARSTEEIRYDALMDGAGFPADEALFLSDLTDVPPYGSRNNINIERYWEDLYPTELGILPVGDTVSIHN